MPRRIIWSEEAEADYSNNINYLLQNWSVNDAREFIDKATNVILIIKNMPEAFPISDYKKVRKALICKQINLLYKVSKSEIIVLRFWDNRQKSEKSGVI